MAMLGAYLGAGHTGKMTLRNLQRWMGAIMMTTSLLLFWLAYTQL